MKPSATESVADMYTVEFLNEYGDWEDVFGHPVSKEKADYWATQFLRVDSNRQIIILKA